jgi:hypothetical protein
VQFECAELPLNGFATGSVTFVARFVDNVSAVIVTQMRGHLSVQGALEQSFGERLEEDVFSEEVLGVLVMLEEFGQRVWGSGVR